ncbi:hypothetical protein PR003_g4444 [Phytophthora rubi]|uniref:HEAT repeat-containing protein 1 n=1 Tax=Phytophthora rubi TaxID=129364 RepID=A0A6A4G1U4_9STRA|nr:hypothetical protein PR002_g4439 [Phytophthora rubi]KAE9049536.1 hypothetical protein PR001_g3222 [Phytophthora rubi]KAE9352314.1 hypothetical protein PR003_g4444 [Phytophthora rubi]
MAATELLDVEEVTHSTLAAYALQLRRCLQWDPLHGVEGQEKLLFVEALTEIAAMPLDSISMEIRRLLVVSSAELNDQQEEAQDAITQEVSGTQESEQMLHLRNLIAALSARDVQLKCKAANAVGSLCTSRVAGQQLLDLYGSQILKSVAKMATCKNQWAQGDAFFVLGWMVVIADEVTLEAIAKLLPTVVKCLHRNVNLPLDVRSEFEAENGGRDAAARRSREALASSEQASNFRVYALVLLLNFSQRHVDVFEELLEKLLPMLRDLVVKLLEPAPRPNTDDDEETTTTSTTVFDVSEYAEILRLTITLLSLLVDQLETAASQLLELKMLPSLLKLKRVLETPEVVQLVGEVGIQGITQRLEAVIETLVNCR